MRPKVLESEWRTMRIDECFDIQQGKQVSKSNRRGDNQHPFLRTANIFWDGLDLSHLDQMHFTPQEEEKFTLQNGDLLLCEGGDVGRTAMWRGELERCYYQNHLHRLRKLSDEIDEHYVHLYLKYAFVYARLYLGRANVTTIPNLSKSRLGELEISLPLIQEQKAIARVLTIVQDAIAEQENLIAKLKELKRSMMRHLFTKGTKGEKTKMTEIGEMPESWKTVELIDVCDKPQYGFTDSASKNGNVKFLRITDITENGVNWNTVPFCSCSEPEKYLLHDGDIVFARIGATTGKSFLLKNPDNAVYASYLIRVRAKAIDSSFLYHYFQTGAYWKQIDSQKGMNLKGGVNGSILSKLLVPMCNGDEQLKIAASLNTINARVESAQAKLASYQDLFKTLLHELMSGERRIKIV